MRPNILDPHCPELASDAEWLKRYAYYGERMKYSAYPVLCLRNAMLRTHNHQLRHSIFEQYQRERKKLDLPASKFDGD